MSLQPREVLDHYYDVAQWERDYPTHAMARACPVLPLARRLREDWSLRRDCNPAKPLVGQVMLAGAFREISRKHAYHIRNFWKLGQFITDHGLPFARIPTQPPVTNQVAATITNHSSCPDAEKYFTSALRHVNRLYQGDRTRQHRRVSVYVDQDYAPIALRKHTESSTALLLQPVRHTESGIVFPVGTIVGVASTQTEPTPPPLIGSFSPYKSGNFGVQTFDASEGLTVFPLRLSPWAYSDPLDRALFGVNSPEPGILGYDTARANLVTGVQIGDFQEAATHIIELCQ